MTPHSYSLDSQSKSSELASKFLDANSPPQISAAISAVESHLTSHSPDQNRHFFSLAFPAFLYKFFGFDVSSSSPQKSVSPSGWIDRVTVSNDPELSGKLFNLLSPNGTLMSSIMAVDRLSLVKFVFPSERLPEWVRGNCEKSGTVSVTSSRMSKLENWALSIPVISSSSKRTSEQKNGCNLYLKLLYAYLRAFVPMDDLNAHHHSYRSSLLHYSPSYDDSVVLHSEFLVETLVHYWLVDASGLGEVVKLFVKYLNLSSIVVAHGSKQVESFGSPFSKKMGLNDYAKLRDVPYVLPSLPSGGSWNSYIQRPLYSKEEDFAELDAMTDASKKRPDKDSGNPNQQQYSADWQGYVLSNYLFYTSLVMHFIGFAHKFLHTDAVVIVQMISRVIDVLISSRELLELIKNVDAIFHSRNAGSGKTSLNYLNKFIPQIREQLQDWEDGLSESDADGSFLHENWNRDLKLFNDSEDGGSQLLQLFIMRAETEIQATSGDNLANNLQSLNSLKPKLHCLFGDHVVKHSPLSPRTKQLQNSRDELFKPRRLGNGSVSNDDYKGDWLRRPISDDEVAWLQSL
ncbi:DNA double-strand break repair Rad50 ATPase [Bienertia sinuspersici]